MKIKKILMMCLLLCSVHETKTYFNTLDFFACWIVCSYTYRMVSKYFEAQYFAKNALTAEDAQRILFLLQRAQADLEVCKEREQELFTKVEDLVQKIEKQKYSVLYHTT